MTNRLKTTATRSYAFGMLRNDDDTADDAFGNGSLGSVRTKTNTRAEAPIHDVQSLFFICFQSDSSIQLQDTSHSILTVNEMKEMICNQHLETQITMM